jgi:CheY-like chemotaxis protein
LRLRDGTPAKVRPRIAVVAAIRDVSGNCADDADGTPPAAFDARVDSPGPDRDDQQRPPGRSGRDARDQGPILLVDDDVELREELAAALTEVGYQVMSAANGREALELLKARPLPRLIVLDLLMPVMNGWDFCDATRRDPTVGKIPIVVTSGAVSRDPSSPYYIDVDDFITKPFNLDELLVKIRRLSAGAP